MREVTDQRAEGREDEDSDVERKWKERKRGKRESGGMKEYQCCRGRGKGSGWLTDERGGGKFNRARDRNTVESRGGKKAEERERSEEVRSGKDTQVARKS